MEMKNPFKKKQNLVQKTGSWVSGVAARGATSAADQIVASLILSLVAVGTDAVVAKFDKKEVKQDEKPVQA